MEQPSRDSLLHSEEESEWCSEEQSVDYGTTYEDLLDHFESASTVCTGDHFDTETVCPCDSRYSVVNYGRENSLDSESWNVNTGNSRYEIHKIFFFSLFFFLAGMIMWCLDQLISISIDPLLWTYSTTDPTHPYEVMPREIYFARDYFFMRFCLKKLDDIQEFVAVEGMKDLEVLKESFLLHSKANRPLENHLIAFVLALFLAFLAFAFLAFLRCFNPFSHKSRLNRRKRLRIENAKSKPFTERIWEMMQRRLEGLKNQQDAVKKEFEEGLEAMMPKLRQQVDLICLILSQAVIFVANNDSAVKKIHYFIEELTKAQASEKSWILETILKLLNFSIGEIDKMQGKHKLVFEEKEEKLFDEIFVQSLAEILRLEKYEQLLHLSNLLALKSFSKDVLDSMHDDLLVCENRVEEIQGSMAELISFKPKEPKGPSPRFCRWRKEKL